MDSRAVLTDHATEFPRRTVAPNKPTSVNSADSQNLSQLMLDSRDIAPLRALWLEAVNTWESKIKVNNYEASPESKALSKFRCYEDLIADLQEKQQSIDGVSYHALIEQMYPFLETLDFLLPALTTIVSFQQSSKEIAFIWAIIFLGIKACLSHEEMCRSVVNMVERLLNLLRRFQRDAIFLHTTENLEGDREIGAALVNVFKATIDFWAITNLTNKLSRVAIPQSKFVTELTTALERVQNAVDRLAEFLNNINIQLSIEERRRRNNDLTGLNTLFPCIDIPPARSVFLGRQNALDSMKKHLLNTEYDKLRSFAIYGTGGVGKTSLALEFAYCCKGSKIFDAIFWIKSESSLALKQSFSDIAYRLGLSEPSKNDSHDRNLFLVKNWLCNSGKTWFLIYDNVEESELLLDNLPSSSGRILITTRYSNVAFKVPGDSTVLEISPFKKDQSLKLFALFRNKYRQVDRVNDINNLEEEDKATDELMSILDGLALGIEHTAAYIENDRLTVSDFMAMYKRMAKSIYKRSDTGSNAPHTIATLWALPLQRLREGNIGGCNLLCILCFFSPDSISLSLFDFEDVEEFEDEGGLELLLTPFCFFCKDYAEFESSANKLTSLALVRRNGNFLTIHRLLQETIMQSMTEDERHQAFEAAAKILNFMFPKSINGRPLLDRWKACELAAQHAISLAHRFNEQPRKGKLQTSNEIQELMKNTVWYLFETGEYEDALKLLEIAYTMCPDKTTLVYAHLCNSAAVLHFELNNLKECKKMNDEAYEIRSKRLPEDDLELANCFHNIGQYEAAQGRFDNCISYLTKAEVSRVKAGPGAILSLGLGYLIIGRAYFNKAEYEKARSRYTQAETIFRKALGDHSQLLAHLLYAFGNLELSLGNLETAKDIYEKGYRMSHELGETHILTATLLYKLSVVQSLSCDYGTAMRNLDKALGITQLRKMEGDSARISRRKAIIAQLDSNSSEQVKQEAVLWRTQAALVMRDLIERNGLEIENVEDMELDSLAEDKAYDSLVCGYYR